MKNPRPIRRNQEEIKPKKQEASELGLKYNTGEETMDEKIQNKINKLEHQLEKIDSFLQGAPVGSLKIQKTNKKPYYYVQYRNLDTNKFERIYLKKKDNIRIKELAQKSYYLSVKPIIQKNLIALKKFGKEFCDDAVNAIYDEMSSERKDLVEPIQSSVYKIVQQWQREMYEQNMKHPEHLKFETDNGELVRSKSELIIANALNREKDSLLYRYEQPVVLLVNGREMIFYPDFTILNMHTGKITYWEHAGMLDDSAYSDDFVAKMNIFQANDIIPGKNLTLTFETREHPLSIQSVRMHISELKQV